MLLINKLILQCFNKEMLYYVEWLNLVIPKTHEQNIFLLTKEYSQFPWDKSIFDDHKNIKRQLNTMMLTQDSPQNKEIKKAGGKTWFGFLNWWTTHFIIKYEHRSYLRVVMIHYETSLQCCVTTIWKSPAQQMKNISL